MTTPFIIELEEAHYPRLLEIWRDAVKATHHFLPEEYFAWLEGVVPGYFTTVRLFGVYAPGGNGAENATPEQLAAFMGLTQNHEALHVEMLFADPRFHRRGLGKALLDLAKGMHPRVLLDVNEQNAGALAFYQKQGFKVTGRSELDSSGKPFPLLHMEYQKN